MNIQGAVESLLFVAGDTGLSVSELVALIQCTGTQVEEALDILQETYADDDNKGLAIVSFAGRYQIVTKGKYAHIIKEYAISPFATKLSQASLETLAIIAYKQPITRLDIDQIRGVQSSGALQKLQMRDLIEAKGRADSPGKPILYGTTDYFMNYFGITDFAQLPEIDEFMTVSDEELQDLFGKRYEQEEIEGIGEIEE